MSLELDTQPKDIKNVHLLGICGTAMTALAGCLQVLGMRVSGSDAHPYPPMSDHLRALGIEPLEGYRAENIPPDTDLVVVGNVITESNPEAGEMRRRGLPYLSMAAAVKRFAIGGRHAIAVVGTHGKTTTTSLAAHVLVELGADPGFLIGGIAHNFGANFRLGGGTPNGAYSGDNSGAHLDAGLFVIEGDEYDTAYFDKTPKFFKYEPRTVIFTSLEFDHADIYADLDAIRTQFSALLRTMPPGGRVIACTDDPNVRALLSEATCAVVGYGFGPEADWRLENYAPDGAGGVFDLQVTTQNGGHQKNPWRIPMPGRYNALNAAAVIAMTQGLVLAGTIGFPQQELQRALDAFQGVRRRQEVRGVVDGITVVDDFAHHPTAVRLTIEAMRGRYPGQRLWAVFEPRSFTARGGRFQQDFTEALSGADQVVLATPFRSGYSEGVAPLDVAAIAVDLQQRGLPARAMDGTDGILTILRNEASSGDVILIMSNGGFDDIHTRLLATLSERQGATGSLKPPITETTEH